MSSANDLRVLVAMSASAAGIALAFAGGFLVLSGLVRRYRRKFDRRVGVQLGRAHLFIEPARLLALSLAASVALTALAAAVTASVVLAVVVALATGALPAIALRWIRMRRIETFRAQMPDVLLLTAGGLRSGVGLSHALARVASEMPAPAKQEIELMLREQRLGATFEEALVGLERRMPIDELRLAVAAMRISHMTGGNLSETLERLANGIRQTIALEGKLRALTAQGRLQARVMAALPVLLAAALFQIDPAAMRPLVESPLGWAVCGFVMTMQALGMWSIRRIVAIDI